MADTPQIPDDVVNRFEPRRIVYSGGQYRNEVFEYQMLTPATVQPGEQYPLVLFLHGLGESGRDNRLQLMYLPEQMSSDQWRSRYPCYFVAPQCRLEGKWIEPLTPDLPLSWSDGTDDCLDATDQLTVVEQILDAACTQLPVDLDRVYLTGLSMGGYGAWLLAARQPDRFAAVAPVCGGGDVRFADRLVHTPLWAVHGEQDSVVPPERSREMIQAIRSAGGAPKYTELAGVAHNSWTPAYSNEVGVIDWLFAQQRGSV